MATKLTQLLDKIDYTNLFEADERRVEKILALYRSEKNTVENYEEYKKCIIEFVSKIYGAILNAPNVFENAKESIMYDLALGFLKTQYSGSTEITVYEIMHSGAEGGKYQILKVLARIMVDKIYKGAVEHKIAVYLKEIGVEEREAAVKEYLEKYSGILPTNYKNDPTMVLISFDKVLREHAYMMKRLREN